jgi:hypothetical protein
MGRVPTMSRHRSGLITAGVSQRITAPDAPGGSSGGEDLRCLRQRDRQPPLPRVRRANARPIGRALPAEATGLQRPGTPVPCDARDARLERPNAAIARDSQPMVAYPAMLSICHTRRRPGPNRQRRPCRPPREPLRHSAPEVDSTTRHTAADRGVGAIARRFARAFPFSRRALRAQHATCVPTAAQLDALTSSTSGTSRVMCSTAWRAS